MEGEPTQQQGQQELPDEESTDQIEAERQIIPRIYVASLSDYNAGRLHGVWLEANQEPEDLQLHINAMLARSKEPHAEEWAIHDFEGFNGFHLGEWEDLAHVSRVARGITEHGLAYAHWATLVSEDEELDHFETDYLGHWDSLTAYAQTIFEDLGLDQELDAHVPEYLQPYVTLNAEAYGRDLVLGGGITAIEAEGGGVYVFSNR